MADNPTVTNTKTAFDADTNADYVVKTDDDGTAHWQYFKTAYGPDNTQTRVTATNGLPIQGDGTALPVSGTVTATPAATGGGTEAAAQRVTIANDSTGLLSVDDGGGSLTVDGTVAVSSITATAVSATTESTGGVTTGSAEILAANASRVMGWIHNISDTTVYLALDGGAAATSAGVELRAYQTLALYGAGWRFTGAVNAIHGGSGTKNCLVVEA